MKLFVSHLLMPSRHAVRQTLWHRFAAVPLLFGAAMSVSQTRAPVYPQVGLTTDFTEFLSSVFYSAPYDGISAAAGHHCRSPLDTGSGWPVWPSATSQT